MSGTIADPVDSLVWLGNAPSDEDYSGLFRSDWRLEDWGNSSPYESMLAERVSMSADEVGTIVNPITQPNELTMWSQMVVNQLDQIVKIQAKTNVALAECEREIMKIKIKAGVWGGIISAVAIGLFEISKLFLAKK